MGLFGRISGSRNPRPASDKDPGRGDPDSQDNLLSLKFSFRHRVLRLEIGPSATVNDTRSLPADEETGEAGALAALREHYVSGPDGSSTEQATDTAQQPWLSAPHMPLQRHTVEQLDEQAPVALSFWDALDPTEREALRSVASWRMFAAGATLMHEGERADHVIVILGGRARVCVDEMGKQHELAERGLGQLIGERAALEISVRSATVIALEMVWALVVQTKDFAMFLSIHPHAMAIVQNQRSDRLMAPLSSYQDDGGPDGCRSGTDGRMAATDNSVGHYDAGRRQHPQPLNGENCTVILSDVVKFGAHGRTDGDRLTIRGALSSMTHIALRDIPDVRSEDRGDGILVVVPPNTSTAKVIDQLLHVLPRALDWHNTDQPDTARFQLRLAVNVGPVVSDAMGVSGEAIIVAARLVEAPDFKDALAESTANLGIIASPFVYEAVIRHGHDQKYVASYSPVSVEVKESRTIAWMKLFDTPPLTSLVPDSSPPTFTRTLLASV